MEHPTLFDIYEDFRAAVIEWRREHSGHCWTARQAAYRTALDSLGVQWLDEQQPRFKEELDNIEAGVKKHNCPCGFSCEDDRYFKTHVLREHTITDLSPEARHNLVLFYDHLVAPEAEFNAWLEGRTK